MIHLSKWPEPSARVRVTAEHALLAIEAAAKEWDACVAGAMVRPTVYLLDLHHPAAFAASLPSDYRAPTQKNPRAGLPPNVWIGTTVYSSEGPAGPVRAERLFDTRARVRWIELSGDFKSHVGLKLMRRISYLFDAWRCSNCGQRGTGIRPARCPHATVLCGDAELEPQLHWVAGDDQTEVPPSFATLARDLGVVVAPELPKVFGVTDGR